MLSGHAAWSGLFLMVLSGLTQILQTAHVGDENWAVYRLFQKKLRPRRNGNGNGNGNLSHLKRKKRSSVIDLQSEAIAGDSLGTPPPSSPCSSSITDNASSCNMLDQEDISSSFL